MLFLSSENEVDDCYWQWQIIVSERKLLKENFLLEFAFSRRFQSKTGLKQPKHVLFLFYFSQEFLRFNSRETLVHSVQRVVQLRKVAKTQS